MLPKREGIHRAVWKWRSYQMKVIWKWRSFENEGCLNVKVIWMWTYQKVKVTLNWWSSSLM